MNIHHPRNPIQRPCTHPEARVLQRLPNQEEEIPRGVVGRRSRGASLLSFLTRVPVCTSSSSQGRPAPFHAPKRLRPLSSTDHAWTLLQA